jgi:hypothetical protein
MIVSFVDRRHSERKSILNKTRSEKTAPCITIYYVSFHHLHLLLLHLKTV